MLLRKIGPAVAGFGVLLSVVLAPAASASTSGPMSMDDVMRDPNVQAMNTWAYETVTGKFTATGSANKANGDLTNLESFLSDGTLVRDQWDDDYDGSDANVLVYNRKLSQTCYRKATVSHWAGVKGDVGAKWKCGKGANPGMIQELGMLVPVQAIQNLAPDTPNPTYTVEDVFDDGKDIVITISSNGAPVATLEYSLLSGTGMYYKFTDLSRGNTVTYSMQRGMNEKMVPWAKMKKQMNALPKG